MVTLNLELALISFLVIPLMVFLVVFIKNKIKENFLDMKHFIGMINGFMAESISGMKIIQIFTAEKEKAEEFLILNNKYFKTTSIQVRLNSMLRPASDVFQSLAIAILIWYAMGQIAGHTLQIGILYAFTTYIKQFFNPISDLADKYNNIQSALVSADRIFDLLKQKDILEDLDDGISLEHIEGSIEFRNVWFAYNNKDWILKNVSFKIEKGQTAAFVGETGNIKNNLTLSDEINEDMVEYAIKTSCTDTFVNAFPQGIDEPVMERGNTLSAGQRQLLSFARAIAHNPSILVLDEATANIDTQTEKLIQQAIENITKDRTTIIIAHRLSTIKNADQIIVMKNGEIVEMGNDVELIKKDGYYKRIVLA